MTRGGSIRGDRGFMLAVLAGGLALRLLWFAQYYGDPRDLIGGGEATRVAFSLARDGAFADAYFAGSGPTAHVLPAMPVAAAAILWLFGPGSGAANVALLGWALVQTVVGYALAWRLFAVLGVDRATLRWGWVLLNLVPLWVHQETVDFRFWDGAAGAILALASLTLVARWRHCPAPGLRAMAGAALLAAATLFVNPAAGIGVGACWTVFAFTRLDWRARLRFALVAALACVVVIGPWAMRNASRLGEPVALRSNFGLELALGNHPAALDASADPAAVYASRMLAIHPFFPPARDALRAAGGEIAYSRALAAATWRWAAAHPGAFATLCVRHLSEFFAPRAWQMYFTGWEVWRAQRAWAQSTIALVGLAWLALGAWRGRAGFAMLLIYVLVAALPYALVQPVPRYAYIVYAILAFAAVDALRSLASAWGPRTAR